MLFVCWDAGAQNFTIVIDPGHGGNHSGAVSGKLLEKDLNLSVAKKFGKLIEDNLSDVKVIYTRTGDTNPSLAQRGQIANRAKADLFFSIHMNSHHTSSANGSSTYVMGVSKSEDNLHEAMRENEVIKLEDDYAESYEGFDPSSAESYIIFSLMQYAHFDHSLALAKIIQKHYTAVTPMRDRGAAQGPFVVLWKPAMPSILTEVGFMSNASDRAYISSTKGQNEVAQCLFDAFCEYRKLLAEEGIRPSAPVENAAPQRVVLTVDEPRESSGKGGYYVQLFASKTRVKVSERDVVERRIDGWYKYCMGPFATEAEALKARDRVRRGRYKDAFVTR